MHVCCMADFFKSSKLFKLHSPFGKWNPPFYKSLDPPLHSQYSLYGQALQHVLEAKYLGLTLDAKLNFNKHIDSILIVDCNNSRSSFNSIGG